MNRFLLNILLAFVWGALTGQFEPYNLFFGFGLGAMVIWVASRGGQTTSYFYKLSHATTLLAFFLKELLVANIRIAKTVLSPRMPLRPAVIAIPLDLKDPVAITLLANLITLTPGTLSLDVSSDRKVLFLHTIWLENEEQFVLEIKNGFEKQVVELFK